MIELRFVKRDGRYPTVLQQRKLNLLKYLNTGEEQWGPCRRCLDAAKNRLLIKMYDESLLGERNERSN